jgi:hypothetical protein
MTTNNQTRVATTQFSPGANTPSTLTTFTVLKNDM